MRSVFSKAAIRQLHGFVKSGVMKQTVMLSPEYKLLDPKELTRKQYRWLRASVEL